MAFSKHLDKIINPTIKSREKIARALPKKRQRLYPPRNPPAIGLEGMMRFSPIHTSHQDKLFTPVKEGKRNSIGKPCICGTRFIKR